MFCGLNGRTCRPRFTQARIKPATIMDFPTFEPVPWIMMALVISAPLQLVRKLAQIARREKGDVTTALPPRAKKNAALRLRLILF
ncbi:hypothetical protein GCM10007928_02920 [Sulfitobacter porphyrae]|nr:hypothetical protein GCM10007928_02920 [Sulfitobacter porphyrae]